AHHTRLVVTIVLAAEGEHEHLMALRFERALVDRHVVGNATDIGLVHVKQHAHAHPWHLPRRPEYIRAFPLATNFCATRMGIAPAVRGRYAHACRALFT